MPFTFDFEGAPVRAYAGESVAAALWAVGHRVLARSPKYHRPRGAFCFAGTCASCLVRIDGQPNLRACQVPSRPDLRCERQNAFPDPDVDLLAVADWLFPGGMDHHRLMTGTTLGNRVFTQLVRQMGGSGTLPDARPDGAAAESLPVRDLEVEVCVAGAGPAGLAAAAEVAHARGGNGVLVIDGGVRPGGSLRAEPDGAPRIDALVAQATGRGVRLLQAARAIGYYPEDRSSAVPSTDGGLPGVLAVASAEGLLRVSARRLLCATGAYDQNLAFPDNDRPEVLAARAVGRLAFELGIRPAERVLLLRSPEDELPYAARLARGLEAVGVSVTEASFAEWTSGKARLDPRGELLAVAARPAPAFELPRQCGAPVELRSRDGFVVLTAPTFATAAAGVYAAGDVTGYVGPEQAETQGRAAGRAIAAELGAGI
jgi:sarcosine oxidase subunit alpha